MMIPLGFARDKRVEDNLPVYPFYLNISVDSASEFEIEYEKAAECRTGNTWNTRRSGAEHL